MKLCPLCHPSRFCDVPNFLFLTGSAGSLRSSAGSERSHSSIGSCSSAKDQESNNKTGMCVFHKD